MAWISVHESIDGPKLRNLYKTLKCSKFEAVGILNYLWMWGLNNVDEDGHVKCADEYDVAEGIGKGGTGSNLDATQILEALIESGWIEKEEGKPLRLHDWGIWQGEKYANEKRMKDHRDSQRRYMARKAEKGKAENEGDKSCKEENERQEPEQMSLFPIPEKKSSRGKEYSASFKELWMIYPRKEGKGETYVQYQKRLKDGYSEAELFASVQRYADKVKRERTPTTYIRKGANFFRVGGDFEDNLPNASNGTHEEEPEMDSYPEEWGREDGY